MFSKLRKKSRNPSVNPYISLMDINIGTPSEFFMMDEVDRKQILRKFDNSSGEVKYCGTYQVLYKTERMSRHYLIMKRMPNEWRVPPEHHALSDAEYETHIVAEYYPGLMCRIYMKGVSEEMMRDLSEDYEKKLARRMKRKQLTG